MREETFTHIAWYGFVRALLRISDDGQVECSIPCGAFMTKIAHFQAYAMHKIGISPKMNVNATALKEPITIWWEDSSGSLID